MKNQTTTLYDISNPKWQTVLYKAIYGKGLFRALQYLDKVLVHHTPLFDDQPEFQQLKEQALLIRIELLRKHSRDIDVLACLCLVCEIDPHNKLARLLKDQYKHALGLDKFEKLNSDLFSKADITDEVNWGNVSGMYELKSQFLNYIIKPILYPAVYRAYEIPPPNGILLYGPNGCGKTFFARSLAKIIGYNFKEVHPGDLASTYVHGGKELIKKLFDNALKEAPLVLFFDEFEEMAPDREAVTSHYRSEVNEFLVNLDNIGQKKILVIAATNRPAAIDKAVLRPGRFDKKIFVPPPDLSARIELIKQLLGDLPIAKINWQQIGEYTNNFTFAELKQITHDARIEAIETKQKLNTDQLINAILEFTPALTDQIIKDMKKF